MRTLLIANLAGGTGKTTLAHSLAVAFAEYGKRTLLIDADPAATLTFLCGVENPRFTARELFDGSQVLESVGVKTAERFTLVPSASRLLYVDWKFVKDSTERFAGFDLVLIDTPTGPNQLLTHLIDISDEVIVPTSGEFLSARGALNLRDFVAKSSKKSKIRILEYGAIEWDSALKSALKEDFEFIDGSVRRDSLIPKSQQGISSILSYAKDSEVASDFRELGYLLLDEVGLI